jgi:hypothetical protein
MASRKMPEHMQGGDLSAPFCGWTTVVPAGSLESKFSVYIYRNILENLPVNPYVIKIMLNTLSKGKNLSQPSSFNATKKC